MIPLGEKCKCGKIHVIKSMEEFEKLSPSEKKKGYKTLHRIFRDGYYLSLDVNGEVWEIYLPLSTLTIERIQEEESEPEDREQEQKEEMEELIDSDEDED
jgi:hypothetical protein